MKNVDNKRKKKRDNLDTHGKELLENYEKKERENCVITLMMIKENRLDTIIKTEKRTNAWKLKMKENRFLIMSIVAV